MKRSVKTVAVNAFGPGASVGFFGSYPRDERFGTNVTAPGESELETVRRSIFHASPTMIPRPSQQRAEAFL